MSWDLYIESNICPTCGRHDDEGSFNYTHNTNGMMRDAGCGPEELHEISTVEAAEKLDACVERLAANPDKYRAMNPPNGWGDYDSLIRLLRGIVTNLRRVPNGRVRVSM